MLRPMGGGTAMQLVGQALGLEECGLFSREENFRLGLGRTDFSSQRVTASARDG